MVSFQHIFYEIHRRNCLGKPLLYVKEYFQKNLPKVPYTWFPDTEYDKLYCKVGKNEVFLVTDESYIVIGIYKTRDFSIS